MAYKYELKNFIDSPDIAEYVTADMFTIGEQAVLISQSKKKIKDKIEALEYLRSTYPEEYYCSKADCNVKKCIKREIRLYDLISRTLALWKGILGKRENNEGIIFAANLMEKGYPRRSINSYCFFSDYESAYQHLKEDQQNYLNDEDLKNVVTYGEILRIPLDCSYELEGDCQRYEFDEHLELVRVWEKTEYDWSNVLERVLTDFYIYIPLPYNKGDIVWVDLEEAGGFYGEIREDEDKRKEYQMMLCEHGDSSDLITSVWVYNQELKKWILEHAPVLALRYATEEECFEIPQYAE